VDFLFKLIELIDKTPRRVLGNKQNTKIFQKKKKKKVFPLVLCCSQLHALALNWNIQHGRDF